MKTFVRLLAVTGLVISFSASSAVAGFRLFSRGGIEFGGDPVLTTTDSSSSSLNGTSTNTLKAGAGFNYSIEGAYSPIATIPDLEFQVGIGLKFSMDFYFTKFSIPNTWLRTPIDFTVHKNLPFAPIRMGAGVRLQPSSSPKAGNPGYDFTISGLSSVPSSTGVLLQAEYQVGEKDLIGLRYTLMKTKLPSGLELNANAFGVTFARQFVGF
ncbi:MAG: hypothetical protein JNL01_14430 [Bdellovibrionales bacterium]|nr:hypothetical protein [Bdellovibrionales bacterium]